MTDEIWSQPTSSFQKLLHSNPKIAAIKKKKPCACLLVGLNWSQRSICSLSRALKNSHSSRHIGVKDMEQSGLFNDHRAENTAAGWAAEHTEGLCWLRAGNCLVLIHTDTYSLPCTFDALSVASVYRTHYTDWLYSEPPQKDVLKKIS